MIAELTTAETLIDEVLAARAEIARIKQRLRGRRSIVRRLLILTFVAAVLLAAGLFLVRNTTYISYRNIGRYPPSFEMSVKGLGELSVNRIDGIRTNVSIQRGDRLWYWRF